MAEGWTHVGKKILLDAIGAIDAEQVRVAIGEGGTLTVEEYEPPEDQAKRLPEDHHNPNLRA